MLGVAFKEWAVVCRALAQGRQSLILRKGGIAETGGAFQPEFPRFWLYPTAFHEHEDAIKPDAAPLFEAAVTGQPAPGVIRLTHFVEVAAVHRVGEWQMVERLHDHHILTSAAVRKKFDYREPGLFVLIIRAFAADVAHELTETPEFAGCKSWVHLGHELPTVGKAVLGSEDFATLKLEIESRLQLPI